MTLKWDYKNRTCDIFMPGYVSNVLRKFQHDAPKHPQHTPSWYVTPVYGAKTQYATKDETPSLTAKQCITIQKVTGSVLYYARAVDPTVLMPLNDIATEQNKATEKTQAATNQLLDYLATDPDATVKRGRLRSRIRSWSVLAQRPKWRPTQSYTNRAGPHTTPGAAPHR
jgi:hypothetical protein